MQDSAGQTVTRSKRWRFMKEDLLVYPDVAGLFEGATNLPQYCGRDGAVGRARLKGYPYFLPVNANSEKGFVWKGVTPRTSNRPAIANHG
jgi:hypothetical protein